MSNNIKKLPETKRHKIFYSSILRLDFYLGKPLPSTYIQNLRKSHRRKSNQDLCILDQHGDHRGCSHEVNNLQGELRDLFTGKLSSSFYTIK